MLDMSGATKRECKLLTCSETCSHPSPSPLHAVIHELAPLYLVLLPDVYCKLAHNTAVTDNCGCASLPNCEIRLVSAVYAHSNTSASLLCLLGLDEHQVRMASSVCCAASQR